jgi:hypothetical protein
MDKQEEPYIVVKGENILDIKKHSFVIDICKRPYDWREVARLIEKIYDSLQGMINMYIMILRCEQKDEDATIFFTTIEEKKMNIKSCITKLSAQIPEVASLDIEYLDKYARYKAHDTLNTNSTAL